MNSSQSVSLLQVFRIFFQIGCLSWGGGGATLAMMHDAFCVRRQVTSEEEFQVLFGLSRIVPGMNLVSLTILLGYHCQRWLGALAALVGLTAPSFTIIVLGCLWLGGGGHHPAIDGLVRGLRPAAAALLLHTGWTLCATSLKKQLPVGRWLWLAVGTLCALLAFWDLVHPAWLVVGAGALGIGLTRWTAEVAS